MKSILVSPFSNSSIRDWPAAHYASLVETLALHTQDCVIRVTGTPSQAIRARDIVRHADPRRVTNDCGRLTWDQMVAEIRHAAVVIGNNSGIAHLSAGMGIPTVCIFGGSHQRREWKPLGENVVLLSRAIACSPCHLDHRMTCPYDKACLQDIVPADVATVVMRLLAQHAPALTQG